MIEEIKKEISNLTTFNGGHNRMHISDLFKILDKYKDKEDIDSKEVTDALCMLLSCALKDKEFETQKEQFHIVYDYIKELENFKNAWEELKQDCKEVEKDDDCVLFSRLEQLERIYGIEVE